MTRTPSNRVGSLISRRAPLCQDSGVGGSSRTRLEPGRCASPSHDERPRPLAPSAAARESFARIGSLTHVLTPHVSALRAPVAANAHMQDRGAPPAGLVRQAPDHRVTRNALAPAASTPPVLTSNPASQHCMVWLNALTRSNPRPSRRVNALRSGRSKIVLGMSRSFRWTVSEPPSSEDLDPYPATTRPTPPTTPTPSIMKSHNRSRGTLISKDFNLYSQPSTALCAPHSTRERNKPDEQFPRVPIVDTPRERRYHNYLL